MDQATSQDRQAVEPRGSRDPEEIRDDIERTRRQLGDTAAALAQKADVKRQARAKVDEVKVRIDDRRAASAERVRQATPESAGQAASTVAVKAREHRTPLTIAGVALGGFVLGRLTARP